MGTKIKAVGQVEITLTKKDGSIEKEIVKNLVVNAGRYHIADRLSDASEAVMAYMAIGSGTAAPLATNTALATEVNRRALTSKVQSAGADSNKVVYTCNWPAGIGTGAIAEAGIFNAVSAGVMLARTTFAVKNKGAEDSMTIEWTVSILG